MVNGIVRAMSAQFPRTLSDCVMLEITQQGSSSITAFSFVQLIPKSWVLSSCKMLCLEMSDLKRCVKQSACPQSLYSREDSDMEVKKDIVDSVTSENQDTMTGKAWRSIMSYNICFGHILTSVSLNFLTCQVEIIMVLNLDIFLRFKWVKVD